jgi:uncharacterized protein (TIGR02246 family)
MLAAATLAIGFVGSAGAAPAQAPQAPTTVSADEAAVRGVLAAYKNAIEKLDATGTERLFTSDSMMFETGGSDGTYANYLGHHLAPELKEFKSFKFSDYQVSVRFLGPATALATETYKYRIETNKGEIAERIGVATSVLRKENGQWKIVMMHNSARKPSAS